MMRKVRDYDAELKALGDKARTLKARKVQQLGELVTTTGADALDLDVLAGALLAAVASASTEEKEAWRSKGAAFDGSGSGSRAVVAGYPALTCFGNSSIAADSAAIFSAGRALHVVGPCP